MLRILVVDDEDIARRGIVSSVDWSRHDIELCGMAENGEQALTLLPTLQPDILLVDIEMPKIDGLTLIAQVRKLYPHIRCVILSGYDRFDYAKSALENGVRGYLLKPLRASELLALCKSIQEEIRHENGRHMRKQYLEQIEALSARSGLAETLKRCLTRQDVNFTPLYQAMPAWRTCSFELWALLRCSLEHNQLWNALLARRPTDFSLFEHMGVLYVLLPERGELPAARDWLSAQTRYLVYADGLPSLEVVQAIWSSLRADFQDGFYLPPHQPTRYTPKSPSDVMLDADALFVALQRPAQQDARRLLLNALDHYAQARMNPDSLFIHVSEVYVRLSHLVYAAHRNTPLPSVSALCLRFQQCDGYAAFRAQALNMLEEIAQNFAAVSEPHDVIAQVRQYILEHYAQPLSLTDLAERFYVNPSYLSSLFYKRSQIKLHDYIRDIRLEKACELLKNTNLNISTIAAQVGYSNHRRFCTLFQQRYGVTAQTWRRNMGAQREEP